MNAIPFNNFSGYNALMLFFSFLDLLMTAFKFTKWFNNHWWNRCTLPPNDNTYFEILWHFSGPFLFRPNKGLSWWVWQIFLRHFMWMMLATDKERSALRVPLFPPRVINQNVPRLRTILPAKPKEQEAAVESTDVLSHKTRKLPRGIMPPLGWSNHQKVLKFFLNSGLRNPPLVNLHCFKNHGLV